MMLCKNMKAMVHSPDGDTNFLIIITGVLQGGILALYLFIINLDYLLQKSVHLIKEWIYAKKARSSRYPAETITDVNYADNIGLLANIPIKPNPYCIG